MSRFARSTTLDPCRSRFLSLAPGCIELLHSLVLYPYCIAMMDRNIIGKVKVSTIEDTHRCTI